MKRLFLFLIFLFFSSEAFSQSQVLREADCVMPFNFTTAAGAGTTPAPGSTTAFDNRYLGCTIWTMTFQVTGLSGNSIEFDGAPDSNGTAGSFTTWANLFTGALPSTSTTYSQVSGYGFAPWLKVTINSVMGTGQVTGTLLGWRNSIGDASTAGCSVASPCIVSVLPASTGSTIGVYSATGGLTVTTIASGAHQVYGIACDAGVNTADTWCNFYDSTSATAGSTAPKMSFKIPGGTAPTGGGNNPQIPVMGVPVTTGLQWYCSITSAGNASAAPVACGTTVFYK